MQDAGAEEGGQGVGVPHTHLFGSRKVDRACTGEQNEAPRPRGINTWWLEDLWSRERGGRVRPTAEEGAGGLPGRSRTGLGP